MYDAMTLVPTDAEQPGGEFLPDLVEDEPVVEQRPLLTPEGVRTAFTLFVVVAASMFVIWNLRPWLWITDTTPTGGDLGAHVWSPAFLRDELLPNFRLSGWTSDWYAGFPAFTFYMVLPSLLIVIVNVGLSGPLPVIASVVIAASAMRARTKWGHTPGRVVAVYSVAGLAWMLSVPVSYGIAIKLIVVLGLITLPASAWAAGKLGGLAFPGPAMLSVASLLFIFDRSYNIYGGNLMSTMAGEFAFSISLSLAMLYIGFAARGMETGRHRGVAAGLLALSGLSHLFPAFFALAATAALFAVRPGRRAFRWLMVTGPVAFLLAAFWLVPFFMNRAYLNDMGWGKERRFVQALWSRSGSFGDQTFLANSPTLQLFVILAVIGAVISGVRRIRFGMAMSMVAMMFAAAFVILPEGRLWNVRIVPFYYLAVYLMAGLAIAEMARGAAGFLRRVESVTARTAEILAGSVIVLTLGITVVTLGMPLRSLPGGSINASTGEYEWLGLSTSQLNLGPGWVEYNFRGYEDKGPTADGGGTTEYTDMIATMAKVGQDHGCGRALWEFDAGRLGSYGTPMSPMLLPHWTDRCIGSMEGLYFEASATTPYHFLMQSELSAAPSRAQRDLPYTGLNVATSVGHLRDLGVAYYMAFSDQALGQSRAADGLTEIATAGPWVIFQVDDSPLVVGLDHMPVVVDGVGGGGEEWLIPSVGNFTAIGDVPLIAASGPSDWPQASLSGLRDTDPQYKALSEDDDRVAVMKHLADVMGEWLPSDPVESVEVTNIEEGVSSISFDVDRIGTPVLVRTSYFPNWEVSGGSGPYRVSPNLMVVVPTSNHVDLTYGRSGVELFSIILTLMGVAALVVIGRLADGRSGSALWDLTDRSAAGLPQRAEVVAEIRSGQMGPDDVADLRRELRAERSSIEMGVGFSILAIAASLLLTSFMGEHADSPIRSIVVWTPAALGLIALVFRFGPDLFDFYAYQRRVIAPAVLIADLMGEPEGSFEPGGDADSVADPEGEESSEAEEPEA